MTEPKTVTMTLRLPPELKARLSRAADQEQRNLNNLLVRWLTMDVIRYEAEHTPGQSE